MRDRKGRDTEEGSEKMARWKQTGARLPQASGSSPGCTSAGRGQERSLQRQHAPVDPSISDFQPPGTGEDKPELFLAMELVAIVLAVQETAKKQHCGPEFCL